MMMPSREYTTLEYQHQLEVQYVELTAYIRARPGFEMAPAFRRVLIQRKNLHEQIARLDLALRVKAARMSLGWSRRQFAEKAGMSLGTIDAFEQARRRIHATNIIQILRTLLEADSNLVEYLGEEGRFVAAHLGQ